MFEGFYRESPRGSFEPQWPVSPSCFAGVYGFAYSIIYCIHISLTGAANRGIDIVYKASAATIEVKPWNGYLRIRSVNGPKQEMFYDAGNDMRRFKITYVRPKGDSTWLYITVEAPSSSAAKEIAQSMLSGMKILNITPVS
jgi:hypothetical protein